ncbi:MAG: hypothetical protein Kow00108_23820 [Calditrichia bacterium]
MDEHSGFLNRLFDFTFSELITLKIIRFLYVMGVFFAGIGSLYLIVSMFQSSFFAGLLAIIISPLVFLLYVILIRVYLEILYVIFKISDSQQDILVKLDEIKDSLKK